MTQPLRVLLVEDSADDALLLVETLRDGGFDPQYRRVETEDDFLAALETDEWEVILADYVLPHFSGLAALHLLRQLGRDIPVIMVSGKIGEEHAVEAMRAGARDYLLKGRLARLAPAITRELAEATSRRERKQARLLREQAEQELRLLSEALEAAANGVVITDRQGKIIWVNPAFTRITGYPGEEALGRNPRILKSGQESPAVYQAMWQTILGGEVWRGQVINRRKDGTLYTEEMTITPVCVRGDEITHFVAIKEDVTARRQAEEERERLLDEVQRRAAELDAALDAIADGLVIYAMSGKVVRMNAVAVKMFGYAHPDSFEQLFARIADTRVETVEGHPLTEEEMPTWRALHGETVRNQTIVIHRPEEHTRWLLISAGPIWLADGRQIGVIVTISDITPLHELQEQQEDLLRGVSHDLRTPLTIISGHVQLLADALREHPHVEEERESVQAIARAAQQMNAMIRDLVDATRLESGQMHMNPQPIMLADFISDLLKRAGTALDTRRIQLDMSPDLPPVLADSDRLERICINLLSNALKYSTPGTPVLVRGRAHEHVVMVSVTDQGPGIAPQDVPRLFERFYRAQDTSKTEGLGLGLYITRLLIEAHGGHIWAESEVGVGSTFYFTLPMA